MKYLVFLLVHTTWLPSGQALYHERSMTTFTHPNPQRNNSYFGFSMTYEAVNKRLIVGAPRGNDIGQVFSCDIETRNCTNIHVHISRNHLSKYKHDFWLGASLKSDANNFYTCAPRAFGKFESSRRYEDVGSKGACIKILDKNYSRIVELDNIGESRYDDVTKYGQAVDSFGWSMDVGGGSFLIGGPAMFTGRVMAKPSLGSQVIGLTGIKAHIKFNFGYSVVMSNLVDTNRSNLNYAIGSPYGIMGSGKVVVYNVDPNGMQALSIAYKLEPKSALVGSMFGAVLSAAYMSGPDQAASLLVGAPAYALNHDYDVGAVFVYYKENQIRVILGKESGGFFGLSMANVGDLNADHRDEVAIAAPYEADGSGVVYVYCGAKIMGLHASLAPLQRLEPRPSGVRGFGLALAPLLDYDQNGCNELAIGSPYSDNVSLLPCFPSVVLDVYAVFPDLKSRHVMDYFDFQSCIKVTYPDKPKVIKGSVNVTLSIIHSHARLANPADSKYAVLLKDKLQTNICRTVIVSTPPTGNYSTLIHWKISAIPFDSPVEHEEFDPSRVLISERSVLTRSGALWAAECRGKVCEPNLTLEIHTLKRYDQSNPYLIGSSESEAISMTVHNSGDTAYDSCVRLRIEGATILAGSITECSRDNRSYAFICKPLGSLRSQEPWSPKGNIKIDMRKLTNLDKEIYIFADLYPRCDLSNKTEHKLTIYLKSDSNNVSVTGKSNPDLVVNMTKEDINTQGKQIEHIYTITNTGVTNWANIPYSVTFPMRPFLSEYIESAFIDSVDYLTPCINVSRNIDAVIVTCVIKKLPVNKKITIIVPIYIVPRGLDKLWDHEHETLNTFITVNLDGKVIKDRVSSTLMLVEVLVPLFVILAAVFLGLLLVGILAWALYECGFLRRKNKENLKSLKKEIKRQTIRKSMMAELRERQQADQNEADATCTIETDDMLRKSEHSNSSDLLVDT